MLFRIIQYVGIVFIVLFSAASIFLSIYERDFISGQAEPSLLYTYASFFEDRFYDIRMKLTLKKHQVDHRQVLLEIDDESLNKIGRWPWSRKEIAKIIRKLNSYQAKVISFDVFFSEPELACNAESPDIDLANSIKEFQSTDGNHVILPFSVESKQNNPFNADLHFKEAPDSLYNFMLNNKGLNIQEYWAGKKVYPIQSLLDVEPSIAHIEANTDSDGVFRHYPLVANIDSMYFPSYALLTYLQATNKKISVEIPSPDSAYLIADNGKIYLNYSGETKVRWIGGMDKYPRISVWQLFQKKDNDPEMLKLLKGKIIHIGSTAFGAHDLRNTPVDQMLPGIIYHMNMVSMLFDGRYFLNEVDSAQISWIILFASTIVMVIVMLWGNPILDLVTVNLIVFGLFLFDSYILIPKGYNTRLFFGLFSVTSCYSWSTFLHFYQSNKEKAKIKGTFSRYLAPSIVNDLLKHPEKLKLGGEKKNITVFFSDVRDFTTISEKLTPEQLTHALNVYMTMMTDTLFEHKGTLDKYIGDAMVAYWGAPVELENHAYWAVKGAIQMIERLPPINEQFEKDGFPKLKHGIGLNTGECSVGNMGSNQIFSYTALGDNMNLGARLESLCKFYGVQLNISEYTLNAIPTDLRKEFTYRTLDKVRVKGKEKAVTIYEVLHPSHPLYNAKDDLAAYEMAFSLYLEQKFAQACDVLKTLLEKWPEDPSFKRMLHICEDFVETPPAPGWDGTYTHKSK